MRNLVNLTLDGRRVAAGAETTILEASQANGIEIPTLCHEPGLNGGAQCRLCLVEIEGRSRLEPACCTEVADGMVVWTTSERVAAARRTVIGLLLSEHPWPCPARESGDQCRLCDYAELLGVRPILGSGLRAEPVHENQFISRDSSACILCSKCVRVCEQVQGIAAISIQNRGLRSEMRPPLGATLSETDCEMCGNCVAACPTGALKAVRSPGLARTEKVATTCGFCGVGCQLELNVRDGRVVGVTTNGDNPVNGKWLCVKGRFGWEFINHPDRLTRPLVRRDGELRPATWEEALGLVASRLKQIRDASGPDSVAFLSSSRCTNEENYLVQKLARAAIGTNSVDQCART